MLGMSIKGAGPATRNPAVGEVAPPARLIRRRFLTPHPSWRKSARSAKSDWTAASSASRLSRTFGSSASTMTPSKKRSTTGRNSAILPRAPAVIAPQDQRVDVGARGGHRLRQVALDRIGAQGGIDLAREPRRDDVCHALEGHRERGEVLAPSNLVERVDAPLDLGQPVEAGGENGAHHVHRRAPGGVQIFDAAAEELQHVGAQLFGRAACACRRARESRTRRGCAGGSARRARRGC